MDHEALVDLFRNRPAMAAEVLREVFGRPLPAFKEARIESTALPEIIPADRRADLVVVLLDEERRAFYTDQVLSSLHEAARRKLEEMMRSGYEFKSEFARTYVAQGREEGKREGKLEGARETKARDVLAFLEARGLEIPTDVQERVLASTDLAELDCWIRRAAVVTDARQLFDNTSS